MKRSEQLMPTGREESPQRKRQAQSPVAQNPRRGKNGLPRDSTDLKPGGELHKPNEY